MKFSGAGNDVRATVTVPAKRDLRIVMQQRSAKDGTIMRSWKGGPPNGTNMAKVFVIRASQGAKSLPVEINYDKVIWSGLSWAVGEIRQDALKPGQTVDIECSSGEEGVRLETKVYAIEY